MVKYIFQCQNWEIDPRKNKNLELPNNFLEWRILDTITPDVIEITTNTNLTITLQLSIYYVLDTLINIILVNAESPYASILGTTLCLFLRHWTDGSSQAQYVSLTCHNKCPADMPTTQSNFLWTKKLSIAST